MYSLSIAAQRSREAALSRGAQQGCCCGCCGSCCCSAVSCGEGRLGAAQETAAMTAGGPGATPSRCGEAMPLSGNAHASPEPPAVCGTCTAVLQKSLGEKNKIALLEFSENRNAGMLTLLLTHPSR